MAKILAAILLRDNPITNKLNYPAQIHARMNENTTPPQECLAKSFEQTKILQYRRQPVVHDQSLPVCHKSTFPSNA